MKIKSEYLRNSKNEIVGMTTSDQKIIIQREYFHIYREALVWYYDLIFFVII